MSFRIRSLTPMVPPLAVAAAFAGLLVVANVGSAEPPPSGPRSDPVAALEGGTPVPDGAVSIQFPWMGKQSVSFTSDAEIERMVGTVSFSEAGADPLGTATLDGKGGGSVSFTVPVAKITTGVAGRDEHMVGPMWLDGAKHPNVVFKADKVERVKPTVYRVTGTWSMHGVEKPVTVLANVRYIPEVQHFAKDVVRLKAQFSLNLKEFGVMNEYVGSPVVSDSAAKIPPEWNQRTPCAPAVPTRLRITPGSKSWIAWTV